MPGSVGGENARCPGKGFEHRRDIVRRLPALHRAALQNATAQNIKETMR